MASKDGRLVVPAVSAATAALVWGLVVGCGVSKVQAAGLAGVTSGAVALLLTSKYPEYRNARMYATAVLVAFIGIAVMFLPGLLDKSHRSKAKTSIEAHLQDPDADGTGSAAARLGRRYRDQILQFESGFTKSTLVSVYVELDDPDPAKAKKASVYVESEALRFYGRERKTELATRLIRSLQLDAPAAACNAAAKGSLQWGVRASAAPGAPPVVTIGPEPPEF
jgi:hypothetical protein